MQVGIVGLGLMGGAMAQALLRAGHTVFVFNRTEEKARPVLDQGGRWASSPAEVARNSQVVLSMLADPGAVAQVSLGPDGIGQALRPDAVHCDMSTVSPESAARLAEDYAARGRRFVQAPVLGSIRQIQDGSLLVFGGGSGADVAAGELAWTAFSCRTWRFETPAEAAAAKLACNMLIAHMITGLGQSLLFAQKSGVPPATLLEIVQASSLGCAMYGSKGEKLLARDFNANFFVRHMLKDLSLASDTARQTRTPLPLQAITRELFVAAAQQGLEDEDYSAVVKVLEGLAGATLG